MTTMKLKNGMQETTHVEGNHMLYKRLRVEQPTVVVAVPVVEQVVVEPVEEKVVVQIPPAAWAGPRVTHTVVHVDFGYKPKKRKKKLTLIQKIVKRFK